MGITKIGDLVFQAGTMKSVIIPDSVTTIGALSFYNCRNLQSILIPKSVTSVGSSAFTFSGLLKPLFINDGSTLCYVPMSYTNYTIPSSVTNISSGAFANCSLMSIIIPAGVVSMGYYTFRDCKSLLSVTILGSVTSIGAYSFEGCSSLTSITIPDGLTTLDDGVFKDCKSLKSVNLPSGLITINRYAFLNCAALSSLSMPDSLSSIGVSAFYNCSSLKAMTLPISVTAIGANAFELCGGLTAITIPKSVTVIGGKAFIGCTHLTIYGVAGSIAQSYAADNWINFSDMIMTTPNTSTVTINGSAAAFEAYTIGGNNYFRLRDLAMALSGTIKQFEVDWDAANDNIILTSGMTYTPVGDEMTLSGITGTVNAKFTTADVFLDGKQIKLTAYLIGSSNYFRLRDIGQAMNFGVDWDGTTGIMIDTAKAYSAK